MYADEVRNAPPRVPDGTRVYAIGDVHGRADLLRRLLRLIELDAHEARPVPAKNVLVYLGDYVDRGPESKGVLDILVAAPPPGFEVVCLLGNHEDLLLNFLDDPQHGRHWLHNGGKATVASYGVDATLEPEPMRARLLKAMPKSHLAFLRRLPLQSAFGDYAFVHAGVRPGIPLKYQSRDDLLWIREEFLDSDQDFGKVVVHGHTPMRQAILAPTRISLDTGAFATGHLSGVVLAGSERRIMRTEGG